HAHTQAGRRRPAAHRRSCVHGERAYYRVPDGGPRPVAVLGHRPGRLVDSDVDGHDDGATREHRAASQTAPFRRRRRVAPAREIAHAEFRMTGDAALALLLGVVRATLFVAGPVLLVSLITGVLVGLFQTVTQLNEASISFVAKATAITVTLLVLGSA